MPTSSSSRSPTTAAAFPADAIERGGLRGMRERAELIDGTLTIAAGRARRHRGHRAAALAGAVVIRVALADDHQLVRAGFRALLDSEPDIEVVAEASGGEELLARRCARPRSTWRCSTSGCRTATASGRPSRSRPIPRCGRCKVVIVTTFELDEYVARAIRAGASGFLVKDTEPVDLIRAVRVVADGEALLSPGITRRLLERAAAGMKDAVDPAALAALTEREVEVLRLVAQGLTNDEIAGRLFLSPLTAKTHVSRIMQKLHARDRVQLVVLGVRVRPRRPPAGSSSRRARLLPREQAECVPRADSPDAAIRVDSRHPIGDATSPATTRGCPCPQHSPPPRWPPTSPAPGAGGWWFLLIPLFWIALFVILFAVFGRRWRRAAAENGYGPQRAPEPRPPGRGHARRALREGRHRRDRVPRPARGAPRERRELTGCGRRSLRGRRLAPALEKWRRAEAQPSRSPRAPRRSGCRRTRGRTRRARSRASMGTRSGSSSSASSCSATIACSDSCEARRSGSSSARLVSCHCCRSASFRAASSRHE